MEPNAPLFCVVKPDEFWAVNAVFCPNMPDEFAVNVTAVDLAIDPKGLCVVDVKLFPATPKVKGF